MTEQLDFLNEATLRAVFAAAGTPAPTEPGPGKWADIMGAWLPKYQVNTPLRLAAFLGQTIHESRGFTNLTENVNRYSVANLEKLFHVPEEEARQIVHDPQAVAERAYGAQTTRGKNLGNTQPGDGAKFIGRGVIQLTGRDNYTRCSHSLHQLGLPSVPEADTLVNHPELVASDPEIAFASALWYWHDKKLNDLADKCAGDGAAQHFEQLSIKVNGGTNGEEQRWALFEHAMKSLAAAAPVVVPMPPVHVNPPTQAPPQAAPPAPAPAQKQAAPPPPPAAEEPKSPPSTAQPKPPSQPSAPPPRPVGGSIFSALIALVLGLFAYAYDVLKDRIGALRAMHDRLAAQLPFDPLWILAGLFVLMILIVIILRLEHHGRLKKAEAA